MNLDYGPEYEEFRKQVKDFCKKYQGLVFSDSYGPRLGGGQKIRKQQWVDYDPFCMAENSNRAGLLCKRNT